MTDSALYISTRGGVSPVTFREAVLMGLADDGGLLIPAHIPNVSHLLSSWRRLPYAELAAAVMAPFVGADLPRADLADLVGRSCCAFTDPQVTPLRRIGPVRILELFHGPTLAFKDVALQFLGNLFEYILAKDGASLNILGATSGDTGSAAIHGVRGRANIHIFVMHPHGRVSSVQERQMTTVLDRNVHNIAVLGTFDDGQRVLKHVFGDLAFKADFRLGAVNSLNWARVLAQIVYYFHAALRVTEESGRSRVQVCVPTGNFGDIFAGYLARKMGAPISRLVLATNENDILARFFSTGVYRKGAVHATVSPSMDIQIASNFERYLFYRLHEDASCVKEAMAGFTKHGLINVAGRDSAFVAGSSDTRATLDTIRRYYQDYGYLLDPHTAVGVQVGERFLREEEPLICLATAHPAKFGEAIDKALGRNVASHPTIAALKDLPTRCVVLPAEVEPIKDFIRATLAQDAWGS